MVLSLQVPQSLGLELVCNNLNTPLNNTSTGTSHSLPQNLLSITGRHNSTSEQSLLEHTSTIGKIHHKLHQILTTTTQTIPIHILPTITSHLKEHGIPYLGLRLSLGLTELSIKPWT
ncbi:hypothetical protein AAHE18_05G183600 [Arachis hypogaea]